MWVWKATLKQTLKLGEVLLYHSPQHLWISFLPTQPSNSINRVSLTTGTTATLMPESIGSVNQFQRWQRDWVRDQCVTVAQLRTGHSPLLAGYLHRIGRWDSATCTHCNGADEIAEHLVLQCPAHDQVRRDIWPGGKFNTDHRRLWDFSEQITAPLTRNEKDRERVQGTITKHRFSVLH